MKRHADFTHLHVHTQYSLLDGACQLPRLVQKAVDLRLPALAVTDHGNLFGAVKFYSLCMKKGVKPILGCELYVAPESRFTKEHRSGKDNFYHIVLLAKNDEGYRNLIRLASLAHLEGFYYKPRIDKQLLRQYHHGLIALSACLKGEVASAILAGEPDRAYKAADEYRTIFAPGDFYLELMDNGLPEQKKANAQLIKIGRELNIPLVATNDVHYLEREESYAHEALLCIQTQTTLSDPDHFRFRSDTFYLRSPEEMKETFREVPDAVRNTLEITNKCNVTMDFTKNHLPNFPLPPGETAEAYLRKLVDARIRDRYPQVSERVRERVEYELGVIRATGFSSYFLIVGDLIEYAKKNHVPVGPGRGSAAGSIVSYILGITDIDPLRYHLLFERFLNPARISMPDIDIDFCYEKRFKILEYVQEKYGRENVAQIITFGTMLARAVIRDVGRVMGFSYAEVDRIAKMVPSAPGHQVTLRETLLMNDELTQVYKADANIKRLIDVAMQLEGLSRHASTHAAGVAISDKPLIERVPLVRGNEGEPVTGFDMGDLEKTGMLKMDFLGLKTLTVIDETRKIIKRTRGEEVDISHLSLEDSKTFALLAEADTMGVFQLESRGMREILRKINPTKFEDLIAVLALYRPGPLGSGMVDDFIERKHGRKPISYIHPRLETVLKETYGIILYQEQTMQIASDLAGFDLSRADLLRKAIGKKIPEIMDEQRALFVQGCRQHQIPEKKANQIFDLIDYFSGYGFNKSHSTAYALISYRTAYLKANYPVEFMAALLTSERNNTDKVVEYVNECNRMKIKVLPPDINTSYTNFTVTDDGNIRFGLLAIKNVGKSALESIVAVRTEHPFKDFFDFCERVDSRSVNKKVIESLIKSGAMDSFGLKRAQMITVLDTVLQRNGKKKNKDQLTLFAEHAQPRVPDIDEWPLAEILGFEKSLLGIYLTGHPLYSFGNLVKYLRRKRLGALQEGTANGEVYVCGVVERIKHLTTRKRNERMAILRIEDETGSVEVVVFPRVFEQCALALKKNSVLVIRGKVESREKEPKILASEVIPIQRITERIKELDICLNEDSQMLKRLKPIFEKSRGDIPVCFVFRKSSLQGVKIKASESFHVNPSEEVLGELTDLVGEENLSLAL
ncbi:MAG: DNA polymerase III subunit alpha [Candidatus Omnitrophica bacterium]|nr:DNA polymerase III subunit alpha [Candidatus Omnitrophota bacterium]